MATLAADLAMSLDPVRLSQAGGMEPDAWQAQMLRSSAPRILLNCSRQSGKSTVTSLLALHTALYEPESLTLMLSKAERQSGELFRKCLSVYNRLGRPVAAKSAGALHLELANGSRIMALPGKEDTIRSFSAVRLLLIDEAAKVSDELYRTVRPMLAVSAGRLVGLSTPYGKRGWWYEAWRSAEPWERYQVPATQCPRISPAFLAEEQRAIGDWFYQQEYLCQFLDGETQPFREEDVQRAFREEVTPWDL